MRLDDIPREWLAAIAALAVLYALAVAARGWWRRARMRRRFARGAEGEREAVALLEASGYAIEGAQVMGRYDVHVDGVAVAITVRADYIVSRGSARFIAEVKTGRVAPKIENAATRRQLLEYQHAFAVVGILLVDADEGRVHVVELPRPRANRAWLAWAVAAAAVTLLALSRVV